MHYTLEHKLLTSTRMRWEEKRGCCGPACAREVADRNMLCMHGHGICGGGGGHGTWRWSHFVLLMSPAFLTIHTPLQKKMAYGFPMFRHLPSNLPPDFGRSMAISPMGGEQRIATVVTGKCVTHPFCSHDGDDNEDVYTGMCTHPLVSLLFFACIPNKNKHKKREEQKRDIERKRSGECCVSDLCRVLITMHLWSEA